MTWSDRTALYHVIDSDGEDFYVVADSFAEAERKFLRWDAGTEGDLREDAIETLIRAGWLIKEAVPRDSEPGAIAERKQGHS